VHRHVTYVTHVQCVTEKFIEMLWKKDKKQAALDRLDKLIKEEGLSVVAQTLGVVHGLAENMKEVMGGAPYFHDFSRIFAQLSFY
jgi:hypothetical protein